MSVTVWAIGNRRNFWITLAKTIRFESHLPWFNGLQLELIKDNFRAYRKKAEIFYKKVMCIYEKNERDHNVKLRK